MGIVTNKMMEGWVMSSERSWNRPLRLGALALLIKLLFALVQAFDRWVTRCTVLLEPALALPPVAVMYRFCVKPMPAFDVPRGNKLQRKLDMDIRLKREWTGRI